MNLLLTNDDGFDAKGITVLAEKLSQKHNVYVLGPDRNRSAVSNCITLFSKIKLTKVNDHLYKSEGFPADCSAIGLLSDYFGVKFDAVLTGINLGANMGTDIIYSGTCAAARQAVLCGVPAVAFSLDPVDWNKARAEGFKFDALAEFALNNIERLISLCKLDYPRMFINVNGASVDSYKGVKFANSICVRVYGDKINVGEQDSQLYSEYVMGGAEETPADAGTDLQIVQDGYVAVSRILVDPVCDQLVDDIKFKL